MTTSNRPSTRRWVRVAVALLAAPALGAAIGAGAVYGPDLYRTAQTGTGFVAHTLCGGVFVSGRDPDDLLAQDLSGPGYGPLRYFRSRVDRERERVSASLFGLARRTAIHRRGLGCTLAIGTDEAALRAQAAALFAPASASRSEASWPRGRRVTPVALAPHIDAAALAQAVEAAFAEPDHERPRRTRALVVVHGGRIVAERYAPGFDAGTALPGWSMTKTVLNALIGAAVREGRLALDSAALLPQWRGPDDPRRAITLDHLLRIQSGLAFDETYDRALADAPRMLFARGDMAGFAASRPLAHAPGTRWAYASGTSVILARALRETFADERDYLRFPRRALFEPLGMGSAVIEPDASGTFVASSFMYATARDWARLGLLYLQDGVWQGRRLLPEGWVDYTRTPAPAAPRGVFGAHVWLRVPGWGGPEAAPIPADAYSMLGHNQQIVAIVPSRDLVIVRLGLTQHRRQRVHAEILGPIIAAFPEVAEAP